MEAETKALAKRKRVFWASGCGLLTVLLVAAFVIFGLPMLRHYIAYSNAREAEANVEILAGLYGAQCRDGIDLGGLSAGPLPREPTIGGVRPLWSSDPGFARLGFAPAGAVRYAYQVIPVSTGVAMLAEGDLDGDGRRSQFRILCRPSCDCEPILIRDRTE